MSELASRLAALRKQAGAGTGKTPAPPKLAATTASVPAHRGVDLAALRRMAGVRERLGQPRAVSSRPLSRDVPGEEIAPGLRYLEQRFAWAEPPAELDLSFARLTRARREDLLHFDTETTGLAGGTGTRAFMIGAADWHDGALRVRQLYITTMAAETAMLRAFAEWIHVATVLVSYNGKSYDAPLLATRYRLARLSNPLQGLTHVDLLHPMRRRYRHVWENCRMQTAERKLLRIVREDDLPGSEAPRAWLTYLRGGSSTDLVRVAEHNLQDVRTLSGLMIEAHGWAEAPVLNVSADMPAGNEK
ncbi:ribonuclease H-like domain-containing protein [Luteibacter flocculans]|uniref:Ribonuclease H-like domain-containing protein n=1 Tax=Luteibacter flocculans TaxID=2780091 RepID=A0ABY4SY18_9GAMM|nr:ribonuclease H-like domain-containing protein [Luteibacter flocculans]URL56959.1 ribonuclease H-like domain-containing protein [Luteibacter flocculans]